MTLFGWRLIIRRRREPIREWAELGEAERELLRALDRHVSALITPVIDVMNRWRWVHVLANLRILDVLVGWVPKYYRGPPRSPSPPTIKPPAGDRPS